MSNGLSMLTNNQRRGLEKLGDVYAPGDNTFPSFSELGCIAAVEEVLLQMPEGDRRSLLKLLGACRFAPQWMLRLGVWAAEIAKRFPGPIGIAGRFLQLGLRGLVFTLYYSGRTGAEYDGQSPLEIIGYDVSVFTGDLECDPHDV